MWSEKQQVVSLSTAEIELYAAVKTASERLGIQSVARDLVISRGLNLHLDASATILPGQSQRIGQGEACRHAESVDTGSIQVRQVRREEEGRHEREPSRLDDETNAETENRAAHEHHGFRVHGNWDKRVEVSIGENMMTFQIAVHAVGYVRWTGGIRVPVTILLKCKFCNRAEFVCPSGRGSCRRRKA